MINTLCQELHDSIPIKTAKFQFLVFFSLDCVNHRPNRAGFLIRTHFGVMSGKITWRMTNDNLIIIIIGLPFLVSLSDRPTKLPGIASFSTIPRMIA